VKKFLVKVSVFFGIFFIALLPPTLLYIKADAYRDFKEYENYSWTYSFQGLGDLSTKKLLKSTYDYNSFVFGSSRSNGLWACYLNSKIPGAKFFHYGNWVESIGGIYRKLKLIDSLGYDIDNVVIYLDTDNTFADEGELNPLTNHYVLTGEGEWEYYFRHYKSFFSSFNPDKLKILLGMEVQGEIFPNWDSDPVTNDGNHKCSEAVLARYGQKLATDEHRARIDSMKRSGFLYVRPDVQGYRSKQISSGELSMLQGIAELFKKHDTNYYVVITPLYDQLKFSQEDLAILQDIFGQRLYDFSGINSFTEDEANYPDRKHFQPYISKLMIDSILDGSATPEGLARVEP
jgi:hypothetical protein